MGTEREVADGEDRVFEARFRTRGAALCLVVALNAGAALSQQRQELAVIDGAGGWSSNQNHVTLNALLQPQPIDIVTNASLLSRGGFLGAFLLLPDQDRDRDGISDEDDMDDDADGLPDAVELSGRSFDPVTPSDPLSADTDQDGIDDSVEAAAGTDPQNADAGLRFTAARMQAGETILSWQARGDGTRVYDVMAVTNLSHATSDGTVQATVTADGGSPPWYATEAALTNTADAAVRYYRVRARLAP